jgi:hypothetical protein
MNVIGVPSPGGQSLTPARRMRDGWPAPALAGAAAFWIANLAISATPVAADYRSALTIAYVPMLVESAAGGLVLGSVVAFLLVRFPAKIPGSDLLSKALLLGAAAIVLLTIGLELPAKFSSDADDPARLLVVATVFNVIRILALAVTIGWVTGAGSQRRSRRRGQSRRETRK